MAFSGFLAQSGELNLILIILAGTIGNLLGSLLAYYIGYFIEETVLLGLIRKYGKFILVSEKDYSHASSWFQKYGDKIIFISRLLPGVRTVISLPAGVFKMDIKKFIVYTTVGCLIWSSLLAYLGFVMGANWQSLDRYYQKFEAIIIAVIVLGLAFFVYKRFEIRKRFRRKNS
jgi:membrane protein DedA with SNARE-associated domain